MDVFCYNPRKPRETLEAFNERLQTFCLDYPVVGINPQILGSQLIIALALAEDAAADDIGTLMPLVAEIESEDDRLEEYLTETKEMIEAAHQENDPRIPVDARIIYRQDNPSKGFAVFIICNGTATAESEED